MLRKKRRKIKEKKSGHAPKNPHTRDASSRLNRATFSFSLPSALLLLLWPILCSWFG
jgi:hypothetical protein